MIALHLARAHRVLGVIVHMLELMQALDRADVNTKLQQRIVVIGLDCVSFHCYVLLLSNASDIWGLSHQDPLGFVVRAVLGALEIKVWTSLLRENKVG